jgi:hypothetical protein
VIVSTLLRETGGLCLTISANSRFKTCSSSLHDMLSSETGIVWLVAWKLTTWTEKVRFFVRTIDLVSGGENAVTFEDDV